MKTVRVNDYDMAFLDIGQAAAGRPPLVCVHGSLNDYRAWAGVMKPLSAGRRLITPSLRHYFPEHWEGQGGKFTMAQHVDDMIALIEALDAGPVDLIGHSRGGHLGFRLVLKRPDLIRKLVLAEPGGTLDDSLMTDEARTLPGGAGSRAHVNEASTKIGAGDLDGGLKAFIDGINGPGSWDKLPAADRMMREDNAYTLLAQVNEGRQPYARSEAEAIARPTLYVKGGDTPGLLPIVLEALATATPGAQKAVIPNAGHSMFRQQPKAFAEAVLAFLG